MNDFCTISLSDKLTPWKVIKRRLKGALIGDFVIAIYNPRSLRRTWQLSTAIALLLDYREQSTPVLIEGLNQLVSLSSYDSLYESGGVIVILI